MDARVSLSFPEFLRCADYSLLRELTPDPDQARNTPNKAMRQVKSGHYVEVFPTPLPAPRYVIHSESFFRVLSISNIAASEPLFMQFFTDIDFLTVLGRRGGSAITAAAVNALATASER